jgi:nitroreductase
LENAWLDPIREGIYAAEVETSGRRSSLIDAILSRKSVSPKHLMQPGPSESEIELILQAALTAPDHGNLRSWRAILIPPSRREELAELFKSAKLEECPGATEDELDRAGQKALNGPILIALLLTPVEDHAQVTVEEQYIALGAALQNVLLAAHVLGYGAMTTSGRKMRSRALREALVRTPSEELVAFVTIGTRMRNPRSRPAVSAEPYVSQWEPHSEPSQHCGEETERKLQTSGCP